MHILKADPQIGRHETTHLVSALSSRSWHVYSNRALVNPSHIQKCQHAATKIGDRQQDKNVSRPIFTLRLPSARFNITYIEDHRTFMSMRSWTGDNAPALTCTDLYSSLRFADDRSCYLFSTALFQNHRVYLYTYCAYKSDFISISSTEYIRFVCLRIMRVIMWRFAVCADKSLTAEVNNMHQATESWL
jgi:hypothetical protein